MNFTHVTMSHIVAYNPPTMPTPTRLSGKQVAQICDAIISGFDRSNLRALTRIELDQDLDVIAGGETMQDLALSLVEWAERSGRVPDLIAAMQHRNGANPAVLALTRDSAVWFGPASQQVPPVSPAAIPPKAARGSKPSGGRLIVPLLAVALLACAAVFAITRLGDLLGARSTDAGAAATAGTPQTPMATEMAAAPSTTDSEPSADQAAEQPADQPTNQPASTLAVTAPAQDWNVGSSVYRLLFASAAQLNDKQLQVDLQLRMTNNGTDDEILNGPKLQLFDGATAYTADNALNTCYTQVSRTAAKDDCVLHFLVDGAPSALTLRLKSGDAQTDVPLTIGGPVGDVTATPTRPATPLAVQTPSGTWALDQYVYEIVSAEAQPYDGSHSFVVLHIAMTNHSADTAPLWGSTTRLFVDSVPRAPEDDYVQTCFDGIPAGGSSDNCTIKFVVPTAAADLQLHIYNSATGNETTVPLAVERPTQ